MHLSAPINLYMHTMASNGKMLQDERDYGPLYIHRLNKTRIMTLH